MRSKFVCAAAALVAMAAAPAYAGTHFSVGFYSAPPVMVAPAPVYYAPAPVPYYAYPPAPAYYYYPPSPVTYYTYPAPAYGYRISYWDVGHRHHPHWH